VARNMPSVMDPLATADKSLRSDDAAAKSA